LEKARLKRARPEERKMYRRILVATDGTDASARAVAHAIALVKALSAEMRVLHVADTGWLSLGPELGIDTQRRAGARRAEGARVLAAALEEARAAGVAVATRLAETDVPGQRIAERIVFEADAWPADLLVLGTHGRRGAERLMRGSVVTGVERRSDIPVLIVRG
jgi:nucleotide-binding universal stress UspA family protein